MRVAKRGLDNADKGHVDLPPQFSEELRPIVIKRAVQALQGNRRQKYGAKTGAGMRASADLKRRRRDYKSSYGHGISRVPRKTLNHRGTRFYWVGAVAPGTVKGRRAHPPKAEKNWTKKINKKENRKAIRSALSATVVKEIVTGRGHVVPEHYPFVVDSRIESLSKTKDVVATLKKLGFDAELIRGGQKKIRAGKGKSRGRKYKKKKSLLIVVGNDCTLSKAASNIPGVDIARVHELNAETLAPGAVPGRATLWSDKAVERLTKEQLFM
jgi:large subunit ribosomal protein L4e